MCSLQLASHKIEELGLDVTLKSGMQDFVENFTLCEMDELNLILDDTFLKFM